MHSFLLTLLIGFIAPAAVNLAQESTPAAVPASQNNPFSTHSKGLFGGIKRILLSSAEKMAEENYSFKPTDEVRSFGQIVGHVADSQYNFCSIVLGEKNPRLNIEQTKTSKADLIVALKDAFAYCDKAYDGITDASAAQKVMFMGKETPKLGALTVNNVHTIEHYGNLVTYMRLKGVVPPTSEPGFLQNLRK